jgi:hypothetical protein
VIWLQKLVWRFRRNRLMRLHTVAPGGKADLSFEGWLVGKWNGHYVLERPRVLETTGDTAPEPPYGTVYEIPTGLVWWREVLAKDGRL